MATTPSDTPKRTNQLANQDQKDVQNLQRQQEFVYNSVAGRFTGVIQVLCGCTSITCGIVAILIIAGIFRDLNLYDAQDSHGRVAYPVWGGIVYLITGFVGVISTGKNKNILTGYLATSLISGSCAVGQIYWEGTATSATKCDGSSCKDFNLSFVMHFMAVVVAAVEFITAVVAIAISFYAVCCSITTILEPTRKLKRRESKGSHQHEQETIEKSQKYNMQVKESPRRSPKDSYPRQREQYNMHVSESPRKSQQRLPKESYPSQPEQYNLRDRKSPRESPRRFPDDPYPSQYNMHVRESPQRLPKDAYSSDPEQYNMRVRKSHTESPRRLHKDTYPREPKQYNMHFRESQSPRDSPRRLLKETEQIEIKHDRLYRDDIKKAPRFIFNPRS